MSVLSLCLNVVSRLTGNEAGSLGLHPAVYFYSDKGRHLPDLFLGMLWLVKQKLMENNPSFFRKFTDSRSTMEDLLISKKNIITQALQIARSKVRYERSAILFADLIDKIGKKEEITDVDIVKAIVPNSDAKVLDVSQNGTTTQFSTETKNQIYLRDSIKSAMKCPICKGLIEPRKSVSYDHIDRVQDGGLGTAINGQLTHPYCNTAIKN